jgi:tape measure domain-containing protein
MAEIKNLKFIIDAENRATAVFSKVESSLASFNAKMQPAIASSKQVAIGLGAAAAALGAFGFSAVQAAADIETQRIGFKTLLGSVEQADEAIKMIQRDAASTPFEFAGLIEANKSLTLVTKNAKTSEDVLLNVGKALAAAGKGQNELNSIIVNLQQIGNTGKISEMDIRQFGFAGVNILELLADYYGVTKEKAGEMVKESKNAFDDLSNAFKKAGNDGGRFANAYTDAAGSLNQSISNLKDQWNIFLSNQGAKLLEWGKQLVQMLTNLVQNELPKFINKIDELAQWFEKNKWAIYVFAGALVGALIPAAYAAAVAFTAMMLPLLPFIIGGAIIGGLIAGIVAIVKNWDMIKAKAEEIWGAITGFVGGKFEEIKGKASEVWGNVTETITSNWQKVSDAAQTVWGGIKDAIDYSWNSNLETAKSVWSTISDFFVGVWDGIVNVFKFGIALATGIIIEAFKAVGIDIVAVVQEWIVAFQTFFDGLVLFAGNLFSGLMLSVQGFFDFWTGIWDSIVTGMTIVWEMINLAIQFGLDIIKQYFTARVTEVQSIWTTLWTVLSTFATENFTKIYNFIIGIWTGIIAKFKEFTKPLTDAWGGLWATLTGTVTSAWENVKNVIKASINWILEKINKIINAANTVAQSGAGALGIKIPNIPTIPLLANGGVVTRPTLAMIGEAGPEAVVPLSRGLAGAGMGNIVINITGNEFMGEEGIADRIGRQLMNQIKLLVKTS